MLKFDFKDEREDKKSFIIVIIIIQEHMDYKNLCLNVFTVENFLAKEALSELCKYIKDNL